MHKDPKIFWIKSTWPSCKIFDREISEIFNKLWNFISLIYFLVFEQICENLSSNFRNFLIFDVAIELTDKIIENFSSFGGPNYSLCILKFLFYPQREQKMKLFLHNLKYFNNFNANFWKYYPRFRSLVQ